MSNLLAQGSADEVGRYHILGVLGDGALGRLYLAEAPRPDGTLERVALRRLDKKLTDDAHCLRLLLEGARVASTLDHKNIVATYDIERADDHYFVATKYLPGESLSGLLKACADAAPMRPEISATLIKHCVEGLRYAHNASDAKGAPLRLLHRDVRPSNVFITLRGDARLFGFEAGGVVANQNETRQVSEGGLAYAAPEDISNAPVDVRTDLFSLGAVFWECLTGRRLFGAESAAKTVDAIRSRYIEPPSVFRPDIPPALDEIALRAVTRDPRRRYQNATEMATAFDKALAVLEWRPSAADIAAWLEEICGRERAALKNQVFQGTAVEASLARLRLVGAMRGPAPELIDASTDATRPSSIEMVEPLVRFSAGLGGSPEWGGGAAPPTMAASAPPAPPPIFIPPSPPASGGGVGMQVGRATPPASLPGLTAAMGPRTSASRNVVLGPAEPTGPDQHPNVGAPGSSSQTARTSLARSRNLWFAGGAAVVAVLLLGVFSLMRADHGGPTGVSSEASVATTGSFLVQSTPPGAQVLIDGDPSGLTTPARITGLRSGRKVNIQVDKTGYGVGKQVAEVPAGGERVISLSLVESVGIIRLAGLPARAEVYVDDILVDGQKPISTSIGAHRLRVESSGQLISSMNIAVQKGEHTVVVRPGQDSGK